MPNCTTTGRQLTITWVKYPLRKDTVSIGPIDVRYKQIVLGNF